VHIIFEYLSTGHHYGWAGETLPPPHTFKFFTYSFENRSVKIHTNSILNNYEKKKNLEQTKSYLKSLR